MTETLQTVWWRRPLWPWSRLTPWQGYALSLLTDAQRKRYLALKDGELPQEVRFAIDAVVYGKRDATGLPSVWRDRIAR